MLDRYFGLTAHKTTVRTELTAGLITFLTMSYIIVVQPAILGSAGMDRGAVMTATCLSAALATAVMGLYARYPIAQAPGMGQNVFFVTVAAAGAGWEAALGAVFVAAVIFLVLSLLGFREVLIGLVSPSMKHAMGVGIGLFIAFVGLVNAGLILKQTGPGPVPVRLNTHFASTDLLVFFAGLVVTAACQVRKIPGAILWGMVAGGLLTIGLKTAGDSFPAGIVRSEAFDRFAIATAVVAPPPSLAPTFLKFDVAGAVTAKMAPAVVVFLFMMVFDTIGTLIGVAGLAGLLKDGKLPRAREALVSDAVGAVAGAALGTSTVTSYIESAAGVEHGGRTGLTAVTVAILFLLALFTAPLAVMVGSYPPITAPALVFVGSMMIRAITEIDWKDTSEGLPAFLTLLGIPLAYSIADGLALGLISYPVVKLLGGKGRDVPWLMYALAALLLSYFLAVTDGR